MFNNSWNTNHINFWEIPLELNSEGFSNFQIELLSKIKYLLSTNSIKYTEEISEHLDLNENNKFVKLVTITLSDFEKSELWIYHDMAEYDLINNHHIFEEWGYLNPVELEETYLKNVKKILMLE